jgi:hypothetical protein
MPQFLCTQLHTPKLFSLYIQKLLISMEHKVIYLHNTVLGSNSVVLSDKFLIHQHFSYVKI